MTKLVYYFADDLAANYLGDVASLSDKQEEEIEKRLSKILYWHQQTQIPIYKRHLQDLLKLDFATITATQLETHWHRFVNYYTDIRSYVLPDIIQTLADLTDPQVVEMRAHVREKQKDYREKFKENSAEEIQQYYQEKIEDRLEDWLGDLRPKQREIVKEWAQQLIHVRQNAMKRHEIMNAYWQEALAKRQQQDFAEKVTAWIVNPFQFYPKQFSTDLELNQQLAEQSLLRILKLVDDEQRDYFKEEVQDWLSILTEIQALDLKPD